LLSTANSPSTRYREKKRKIRKHCREQPETRLVSARLLSNTSTTSIEAPGHAVDALLPATLQVALFVELLVIHVALEVRSRSAVVGEHLLHVEELARGFLRADFLAGFVGFAVFGDGVGEGFGAAGVHVRAAGFGAEVRRVGGSGERDGLGFGDGFGAADCDGYVGKTGGFGDGCAVDEFCGRGGCEADEGGCGGGDVACDVDGGDLGRSSDVQA